MTTDLTTYMKTADLPALNADQMAAALEAASDEATEGAGGGQFLYFSGKSGRYTLGRKRETPDPEMLYIVEPLATTMGWVCWKQSKPIDRHEWSILKASSAVAEDDLADHSPYRETHGEGWQRTMALGMLTCTKLHDQVKFSLSSKSGLNAMSDLTNEIAKRIRAGEPEMPVVRLGAEEFTAQDQTNMKPVFDVVAWVKRASVDAYLSGDLDLDAFVDGEDAPKKKGKGKAKAKPQAQPEPADEGTQEEPTEEDVPIG